MRCCAPTRAPCRSPSWPQGVDRPADFIGLHFFSPVDKMPLVEIIAGKETSDTAIAQAIDVVQLIKKTPIVVNDSRGFYTSRVIGTQINEGIAMLGEGVSPVSIDRATTMAGYPVGPLQITDELNMELMAKIRKASKDAVERDGGTWVANARRAGHRHDDRARPLQQAQGRRLLRLRRVRQAAGPLGRSGGAVPGRRGADPAPRHPGPSARDRGHRDDQVLRRGRPALLRRGQHRLDLRHRVPAARRVARSSTSTVSRAPPAAARRVSWPGRASSRRRTAIVSSHRPPWSPWPRPGAPTPPDTTGVSISANPPRGLVESGRIGR